MCMTREYTWPLAAPEHLPRVQQQKPRVTWTCTILKMCCVKHKACNLVNASTLVSLNRDAINTMWRHNTSTQFLKGVNRPFPFVMTSTQSCDRPYAALQLCFKLPTSQIYTHHVLWDALSHKTKAQERTAPLTARHPLLRGNIAQRVWLEYQKHCMLCSVRTAVHSWKWAVWRSSENTLKWATTPWQSTTTTAWSIFAANTLRRWKTLIKCCLGQQQQCVQEKEYIL